MDCNTTLKFYISSKGSYIKYIDMAKLALAIGDPDDRSRPIFLMGSTLLHRINDYEAND